MDKELVKAYNKSARDFLKTRTKKNDHGFWNREVEQPLMFEMVPKNLPGMKLLDLGCGPGIHIKEYLKRGADCYGVDFSKEMIRLAKKRCPKAKFDVSDIGKLKFGENEFDIVTASLVLDHIKDLKIIIKEIKRVLKRKGLFIFSVPHPISNLKMDPDNEDNGLKNYFSKKEFYFKIAGSEKKFVDYPRIFEDYFDLLIPKGFQLRKLVENRPKREWKKKYPRLNSFYFKAPYLCFFKFEKN